jgi:hypothetical protein
MTTIAQQIADKLDNDGLCWTAFDDGAHFYELVAEAGATKSRGRRVFYGPDTTQDYVEVARGHAIASDITRYKFPDDSAIVTHGDCWDIEGSKPFVMMCTEEMV